MVIVSQDKGQILFPESGVVVAVGARAEIVAYSINTDDDEISVLGSYESGEEAWKALNHMVMQLYNKREIVQTPYKLLPKKEEVEN